MENFSVICGNLSERVSGKQSSLNLSTFFLNSFVEMFQFSFNFESSESLFFQQSSLVEFYLSVDFN